MSGKKKTTAAEAEWEGDDASYGDDDAENSRMPKIGNLINYIPDGVGNIYRCS